MGQIGQRNKGKRVEKANVSTILLPIVGILLFKLILKR